MKWVDYVRPQSVSEAVAFLAEGGERAKVLAGGTDILVQVRGGSDADLLVGVEDVPELNELTYDPEAGLTLGAAVPCYKFYANPAVTRAYAGLVDAAAQIGGIQIQGRASLGGNLCNASPSADAIPPMIALGATAEIVGPDGTRRVPVEEFCTGPRRTVLKPGELLVSLHFPVPDRNSAARYLRFTPRNEMDIAVAGSGVSVTLDNGTFKSARVVLSAVAPTPLFVKEAGDSLVGQPVSEASVRRAAEIARDAARPITDMRGTVEFRKHLCEVLTRRALNVAIERAKEGK